MKTDTSYDVIVVGGGPAGLGAALEARSEGSRVLLIERNDRLGGILPQCIHNGFGAVIFGQDLPGPQYAAEYVHRVETGGIDVLLDTFVLELTSELDIFAMNSQEGYLHFRPRAVVLAMGCRERTRSQIRLPGTRAAGIYTAGTVQRLVNIEGYMPGRRFVVLGSGDIGMIMARRLTIEGAEVVAVLELLPYLTGLRRNYVQCLEDYGIPLELCTTITDIIGRERVEAVETSKVDPETRQPIPGTERRIECDSVLLSVGLIPENELSRAAGVLLDPRTGGPVVDSTMATSVPGIFAAGNVTSIYDLVDYVTKAGETAGRSAARHARNLLVRGVPSVAIAPGANVGTVMPQRLRIEQREGEEQYLVLRPNALLERPVKVEIRDGERALLSFREMYARPAEMIVRKLRPKDFDALSGAAGRELVAVVE
ncbi:NAD(P)/FAD-dependent oxidoreductase [Salinispira pacifica]